MSSSEVEARRQLTVLSTGLRDVLAAPVGAYLHGSTATGRLRPQSDIDVLVVAERPLADDERHALVQLLLEQSGRHPRAPGGPRSIELTVVTHGEVRPWRYPPRCDLLYGEWLRTDVEAGAPLTPFSCPDLAILLRMVLQAEAVLFGPPAHQVLDAVPTSDLVRASLDGVPGLVDDAGSDTSNVLLTLARAWRTCATGDVLAKDAAADWAMARSEPTVADLLARARGVYLGTEHADWSMVLVSLAVDRLVEQIERAAGDR